MKNFIILFIFSIIYFGNLYAQKRKIIDVHFHARSANNYGTPPPPNHMTGRVPTYTTDHMVIEQMYERLKENNVVMAITSGSIERIKTFVSKDNKMFIPALDFPNEENSVMMDTSEFIKLFIEQKFRVFGELALQYEGKSLKDPDLQPYLRICERLGIPVAVHTGEGAPNTPFTCCPKFRTAFGHPQLIEDVLIKYPKIKLQLMHMGYPYLDETLSMLEVYPNLYADISVVDWAYPKATFYRYLQTLIDAGFGKRLMYGSDQMAWDDAITLSIKNVEDAPFLNELQKQDIFYNNARRFYNLKMSGEEAR